jgi:hypothetical protein
MRRVVVLLLLDLVAVQAAKPEPTEGAVSQKTGVPADGERDYLFWGALNGVASVDFQQFTGLRFAGSVNWGFGWFHLGAGYAYTRGSVSNVLSIREVDYGNFFAMFGLCFEHPDHVTTCGVHIGPARLEETLSLDEESDGPFEIMLVGMYCDFALELSENLALSLTLRTDHILSEVYYHLYGVGAGLGYFF